MPDLWTPPRELLQVPPAHLWVPPTAVARSSAAADAVDVAASVDRIFDPSQRLAMEVLLAEREDGNWAALESLLVVARQNLKTFCLEVIVLVKAFLYADKLTVWTSHEYAAAMETFRHFVELVENYSHLSKRVRKVVNENGSEGIELLNGARIIFRARSRRAGRSLAGNTIIFDEAFALQDRQVGAILPILQAVPNAQAIYGSSAGDDRADVLRDLRDRGRSLKDPSLTYLEWAAEPGCASATCDHRRDAEGCGLDDEARLRKANPAVAAGRLSMEKIRSLRRSMPPREFAREIAGWWENPTGAVSGALDTGRWADLADPLAERGSPVVFGLDVTPDRMASIAVAWRRPDGAVQVMLAEPEIPAHDAVERCAELARKWRGRVVPPRAFEADLERAGAPVRPLKAFAAACGAFADAVTAGTVRHGNQPELNLAVKAARKRAVGTTGEWAWELKDCPEVGPLVAATRAVHGLVSRRPPAAPQVLKSSDSTPGDVLTRMGF